MSFSRLTESIEIQKPLEKLEDSTNDTVSKSVKIESPYEEGRIYHTTINITVRVSPKGEGKFLEELDRDDRKQAYANMDGKAILRKGAAITCRGLTMKGIDLWMKIDSGYICARKGSIVYVS